MVNPSYHNPVSVLNELRVGAKYEFIEQSGPSHAPNFTVSVEVNGQKYYGHGRSKKVAKSEAAKIALKSFIQFPGNCKVISPNANTNLDFTSDTFELQKEVVQENVENNQSKKNTTSTQKSALMILNELYPSLKYELEEGKDIFSRFKITISLNGETFIGTGNQINISLNLTK